MSSARRAPAQFLPGFLSIVRVRSARPLPGRLRIPAQLTWAVWSVGVTGGPSGHNRCIFTWAFSMPVSKTREKSATDQTALAYLIGFWWSQFYGPHCPRKICITYLLENSHVFSRVGGVRGGDLIRDLIRGSLRMEVFS